MFRKIVLGTFAALSLAAVPCAALPAREISLGGIPLRQKYSVGDVKRIYGGPTKESYGIMEYGYSVRIFSDEAMISGIEIRDNNGWETPAGVHVGMTQEEVLSVYGKPDDTNMKGNKTLHVYFDDARRCALGVVYDKNDEAVLLTVRTSLMADFQEWYPHWKNRILE